MVAERNYKHTNTAEGDRKRKSEDSKKQKCILKLDDLRKRLRNNKDSDKDAIIIESQEELEAQLDFIQPKVKSIVVPVIKHPRFVSIGTQTTTIQTRTLGTQKGKEPTVVVHVPTAAPSECEKCRNRSANRNKKRRESFKRMREQLKPPQEEYQ